MVVKIQHILLPKTSHKVAQNFETSLDPDRFLSNFGKFDFYADTKKL